MNGELVAVVLCLIGSAFFSSSETALTALPLTRLEALRLASGRLTRAGLDRWADAPQELLITILVGNNLVNVLASALATSISYRLSADRGLASVVGIMTLVILVFGEITPKTIAQQNAGWLSVRVSPILYVLDLVLRPLTRVLGLLARLLTRSREEDVPVTEQDLLFMLRLAHRHAQLQRDTRHMIESVLRFQRAVAREIMTPRPMVSTVDASWDLARLRAFVSSSANSRFPVVDGSPDDIVGMLHARQLLGLEEGQTWSEAVVSPIFVPESRTVPDLLQDFRRHGQHLAIVLDEYGGFSGVVSLEDALELVVGEIEDEFDQDREDAIVTTDGGLLVPGHLSLRRLEAVLHRTIEQPEGVDSVGGLVSEQLDEDAAPGAVVSWDGIGMVVVDAEEGRPRRVLVKSEGPRSPGR